MNDTLLYTLPQWFIFAAIFVTVYGWIEHKKPFRIIGALIFVALGIFAMFVFAGDYLAAGHFLTLEEIADQELTDDAIEEIPFQAKLLPAYISFIVSAVFAIPAVLLDVKNKKGYQWFIVLAGLVSMIGFFIIVGAIRSL